MIKVGTSWCSTYWTSNPPSASNSTPLAHFEAAAAVMGSTAPMSRSSNSDWSRSASSASSSGLRVQTGLHLDGEFGGPAARASLPSIGFQDLDQARYRAYEHGSAAGRPFAYEKISASTVLVDPWCPACAAPLMA
jgi:hypothetical protein